ncbi:MAG: metallophosphoesterase family protein [Pseudomonadota bacterium]
MTPFDETRFAVIADIHSNADALAAVLDDIDRQGIVSVVNLGDHLSGPLAARETAETLMQRDFVSIQGNHDRWLLTQQPEDMGSIDAVAHAQLGPEHLGWLRNMPATLHVSPKIFACHGTPTSDETYWTERVTDGGDIVLRDRAQIEREAEGIDASLFLCGHTHLPRRIDLPEGRVILNPGSVGCPAYTDDAPRRHSVQTGTAAASYAIVEKSAAGWITTFRHIPYDPSRMIACAKRAEHANWVSRIASGWVG